MKHLFKRTNLNFKKKKSKVYKKGYKEITYKDGNKYKGYFSNGEFHGKGVYIFKNGGRHEGTFNKGLPEGYGIIIFSNGDRYEGGFHQGKFHGKGIWLLNNGLLYIGGFYKNNFHGKGIIFNSKTVREYRDNFLNGKSSKKGVLILKHGKEIYKK